MTGRLRQAVAANAALAASAVGLFLMLALYFIEQPLALSPFGVQSLVNAWAALALVAIGQTCVLLAAGVDLSVGAIVSLVDCFAATIMGDGTLGIAATVAASLALGTAAGTLNGVLIAFVGIEPLICTFGTLFVFGGAALLIRPQPGGHIADSFATLLSGNEGWLPNGAILVALLVAVLWIPMFRSRIGRFITAVGDAPASARASGLPVRLVRLLTYAISGFFAAAAALFLAAETTSGDANIGTIYTLNSLAAAVLGGVSLAGGKGRVAGALIGAAILSVILDLLSVLGIASYWQDLIEGLVLVAVLGAAGLQARRTISWVDLLAKGRS